MLLAIIFSLSLGSDALQVDKEAATAPYEQQTDLLTLLPPFSLSDTLGGAFIGSPWNWSSVDTIFLDAAIQGANPIALFTLQLFGAGAVLINKYEGSTVGLGAGFSLLRLNQTDAGSGDFSSVVGMQFTWEGGGASNSGLIIRSLVGSQGEIDPVITSIHYGQGQFAMTWSGTGTLPVNVERRQSLNSGGWTAIAQQVATGQYTDTNPPPGKAFYRIVLP